MASKRELNFWKSKVRQGSLIPTLRAYPKRAIRFFGAHAVLRESERTLHQILDAQDIVSSSDRELTADWDDFMPGPNKGLETLPPQEWQQWKDELLLKMKHDARQILALHLGVAADKK
jgi:hypothetical protein